MKSKHHFYIGAALTVFLVNSVWGGKSFRDYQRELLDQSQSEFLQKRLSRDFFPDKKPGSTAGNFIPAPLPTLDSLADFKVNQDPFSATYPQTHPRVIIFPSKSILAVWEETRNGDYDIYAQKYDSNGVALGSNFQVNFEYTPQLSAKTHLAVLDDNVHKSHLSLRLKNLLTVPPKRLFYL